MGARGSSEWPAYSEDLPTCATSNDTNVRTCFARGKCEFTKSLNYSICACPSFDPISYCEHTIYEFFPAHGAWLFGCIIAVYLLFTVLFALELVTDLRRDISKTVRTVPFYAKLLIFAYCVLHSLVTAVKLHDGVILEVATGTWKKVFAYISFFSGPGLLVGAAYQIVCVTWLDMLLRAKNLGVSQDTTRRLRVATIVVAVATYGIAIVCSIMSIEDVFKLGTTLAIFSSIAGVIGQMFSIIVVTVMLTKALLWLRTSHDQNSKRMQRIRKKGYFLAGINIVTVTISVYGVARLSSVNITLPPAVYTTISILETFGILTVILFLFFLENYLLMRPLFGAYLRGYSGSGSNQSSGSDKNIRTPTSHPSGTTSSTRRASSESEAKSF